MGEIERKKSESFTVEYLCVHEMFCSNNSPTLLQDLIDMQCPSTASAKQRQTIRGYPWAQKQREIGMI